MSLANRVVLRVAACVALTLLGAAEGRGQAWSLDLAFDHMQET